MEDCATRTPLPIGTVLDNDYTIVEHLSDENTETILAYKTKWSAKPSAGDDFLPFLGASLELLAAEDYLCLEYYQEGCATRAADGSLQFDDPVQQQRFNEGCAQFTQAHLKERYGFAIAHREFNQTAYAFINYANYQRNSRLNKVLEYASLPAE